MPRLAIGAGVLVAIFAVTLFFVRPVPDAVLALLGGPDGGVDRHGGVRVRYRPPPGLDPAELARMTGGSARWSGDALVLEYPGVAEDMGRELEDILVGGGLEMRESLESDYARQLARAVPEMIDLEESEGRRRSGRGRDPGDRLAGVILEPEEWRAYDDARVHHTEYLRAGSRDELERVLALARSRGWLAAPGTEIGFEKLEGYAGEPPSWRTHELATEVVIDGTMIGGAVRAYDPQTNRPIVLLDFTRAGARRFCDVTANLVGRKLATVLGGWIRSAPIINSRICGGRASITMGGADPRAQEHEASLLTSVLSRPVVLPPGGEIIASTWHAPADTAVLELFGRLLLGLLAGALAGLLTALVIRIARPRWRRAPEPVAGPLPYRRLAVTLLALPAVYLGGKLALPGIDSFALEGMLPPTGPGSARQLSVVAVGVMPILTAFTLVEIVALAIPRLRWRRHDPRGRAALGQAVCVLSIAIAAAQGYFIAVYIEAMSQHIGFVLWPGLGFRLAAAVTLTTGTLLLGALAGVIREHGLGNGYGAILVASGLVGIVELALWGQEPPGRGHVLGAVALAVIAAFTVVVLRWRVGDPDDERAPALRVPASGIAALSDVGGLALILGLLGGLGLGDALGTAWGWVIELRYQRWVALVLAATLAVEWAHLFARPRLVEPVARAAGLPPLSWGTWRRAVLASVALLAVGHAVATLAVDTHPGAAAVVAPILVMLGTAVVLDIIDDARAHRRRLAPAGVLHQIQHASVVERVLADAGIPCHVHAGNLRTLLAFFGPFAPAIVLVPESLAADARRRLEGLVAAASGRGAAPRSDGAAASSNEAASPASGREAAASSDEPAPAA
jgi:SecY